MSILHLNLIKDQVEALKNMIQKHDDNKERCKVTLRAIDQATLSYRAELTEKNQSAKTAKNVSFFPTN
jgi:hypothetical protein